MQAVDVEKVHRLDGTPSLGESVVEVPVLLERELLRALEAAANDRGLSAGCVVRRLIRAFLTAKGKET